MITARLLTATAVALAAAPAAFAHGSVEGAHPPASAPAPGPRDWHELCSAWAFEPLVVVPLALTGLLYAAGLWRLWRKAGTGHGVRRWEAGCFAGGWLALAVALVSPLHPWGNVLFAAHMTQHELLMLVAAPLLVLGRPVVATLTAVPPGWARAATGWTRSAWVRTPWGWLTHPLVAWAVHAAVLWAWHAPVLFGAALHSEFVHAVQHLTFLLSAVLFWWALLHRGHGAMGYGVAVLYVFTTAVHSGLLGAVITLAGSVWYPDYQRDDHHWGLTPLEDQQLGGVIMWVPACSLYIIAGLALFAGWLRAAGERARRREAESAV